MEDFVKGLGTPFMAHLLRRLYDDFVRNIECWYGEFGVRAPPRTHSTMAALGREGPLGVTQIAALLRQSHPLVLTWIRQLKLLGFVETRSDPGDARRTVVSLTEAGRDELARHLEADRIVGQAYESLMRDADAPVFDALWRIEAACRETPFVDRLRREAASPPPGAAGPAASGDRP